MNIPPYLAGILAKSDGETLFEHTWNVLSRLADQARLRPEIAQIVGSPRLWHRLYWACLIHDFGKAAPGFQRMLASNGAIRWPHRHEVASLALLPWVLSDVGGDDYIWVVAAIVSHHKDAAKIGELYKADGPSIKEVAAEIAQAPLDNLWRWLSEHANTWRHELGLAELGAEPLPLLPQAQAVALVRERGVELIEQALRCYRRFVADLSNRPTRRKEYTATLALRGLTVTSDHSASAHTGPPPSLPCMSYADIVERLGWSLDGLYEHQRASATAAASATLIAPTGSGKTEAALCWTFGATSRQVPRLFYALPFQASMNAMQARLVRLFPDLVGLQHGRALQALYRSFVEEGDDTRQAVRRAKERKNRTELNYYPIRVFSPYQMLKGCYKLRGFEAILSDFFGASFIFDEIHAYEPRRLALILRLVRHLREQYAARFFIMSATFPNLIKGVLKDALGPYEEIQAEPDLFRDFQRHHLLLLDGDMAEDNNLERIIADARAGRSVLVCCNTVARAQQIWRAIRDRLGPQATVVLLHSRLIGDHRLEREQQVMRACGLGSNERQPVVLVATQVVEVSLNIDLDTIYTDPAPLEALIQRFGRVNRGRRRDAAGKVVLAPVHVFRAPVPEQDLRPYDRALLLATLRLLEEHTNEPIAEHAVGDWLNTIYDNYAGDYAERWRTRFDEAYQAFSDDVLRSLVAFDADTDLERLFYSAFDSIEVLPQRFAQRYLRLINEERYVEASGLFVGIASWQYSSLARAGKIQAGNRESDDPLEQISITTATYDDDLGLLLYSSEEL
jgi:CRISPR-associated endonuclease/helicase Cas3